MRTLLAYGHKRAVRTAAAAILVLATAGYSASTALAADSPLSAVAQSKIVDTGSSWTSAFSTAGRKLPVIVEFAMPELPALPATASEGDRDKAHVEAVRAVQEKILAGVLGSGPAALSAAQSSEEVNLKLMPYSPQFAMNVSAEELERIAADPAVVKIYEDEPVPPLLDQSVPLIGMTNAYAQGATGNGYRVAVLDTGARRGHEFLNTRVTHEACFNTTNSSQGSVSRCPGGASSSTATGSGEDCNSTPIYGCGHGTHVSGTAAGFNSNRQSGEPANGVARDGRLLAINVFSQFAASACGSNLPSGYSGCVLAYTSDQVAALNYVNSVRSTLSIASVNMSLGGGAYSTACDSTAAQTSIVNTLRANNVAVVIAAGNDGLDTQVGSPGCISSAITVASSTKSDVRSSFSNWGNLIDVVAPGSSIYASYTNNGNVGYSSLNGTSMATPHVAGVWAALRSRVPTATVTQIENALKSTGLGISSVGYTKPRVRVDLALAQLLGTPPPTNNDNFANRVTITPPTTTGGTVTVTGNNAGFTLEPSEPIHANRTSATTSAWWRYTPASSGQVTVDTNGSSFDVVLGIYTGNAVNALTTVASQDIDNRPGNTESITFTATAGVTYNIAVAGYGGAGGAINLAVTGGGGSVTPTTARLVAAITPVARRGVVGGSTITAFATVINPSDSTASATGCTIAKPAGSQPYNFAYAERLLPSTNLGPTNASFSLTPGQARHFLLAYTPTAAMSANLLMVFDCANTSPAPTSLGLNSFNLVATTTAGADILASAVTATNDGILRIPVAAGGGNAAAMAAQNIGTTATVNARISTVAIGSSAAPLPVNLLMCRTNPSTGACVQPTTPTASPIAFTATANQLFTFAAFVNSQGTALPLDPATRRVYIHFDQGGTSVGSASVAVTTQGSSPAAVKAAALD